MGKIIKISGPLIVADGMQNVKMYDVVKVSDMGLIGEVIELRGDRASIQVYEETSMLGTGEPVETTEQPLSAPVLSRAYSTAYSVRSKSSTRCRASVSDAA